jgi:hypothetical protein
MKLRDRRFGPRPGIAVSNRNAPPSVTPAFPFNSDDDFIGVSSGRTKPPVVYESDVRKGSPPILREDFLGVNKIRPFAGQNHLIHVTRGRLKVPETLRSSRARRALDTAMRIARVRTEDKSTGGRVCGSLPESDADAGAPPQPKSDVFRQVRSTAIIGGAILALAAEK